MVYGINIGNYKSYMIEAENENEAKLMACDIYYAETGKLAYTDDDDIVCVEVEEK